MSLVLVADDDPDICEMVAIKLELHGHRVITVHDGAMALDAIRTQPPDLALLDVSMPELSGWEVCRQVRANTATADLPVIFITARAQDADIETGFNTGADDYICKPFSPRELVERVEHILARADHR